MSFRKETLAEGIELYNADCREVLPTLCGIDLFFFSPPYNLGNTSGGGFQGERLGKRGGGGKWSGGALADGYGLCDDNLPHEEYVAWQKEILAQCWRALSDSGAIYYNHKPRVLNGSLVTPFVYNPELPVRQVVIWARAGGVNFSPSFYCPTHEWVCIFAKERFRLRDKSASGAGDTWYIPQEANSSHPAPFPIALPTRALETVAHEQICDPFMGSGTTGVACVRLGRKFIGIEIEPKYFDIACKRISEALKQPDFFVEKPKPAKQEELL